MSNLLLYLVTVLIWGSTWLAVEFQLGIVPPDVSVVYRYVAAAAMLFVWCGVRGITLRFGWRTHLRFAGLGVFLFGLNYLLAYSAQIYISSALTAIAFSCILWMNILNARLFFGTRSSRRVLVGAAFGVVGVSVLFAPEIATISWTDATIIGCAFTLGSAAVASFGTMISQAAQAAKVPILQSNAWGMLYGACFSAIVLLVRGGTFQLDPRPSYWISFAYLSVFGSIVGFSCYLTLVGRIGAHRASYALVAPPVVALALSVAFEGMQLTGTIVVGAALVLVGNVLVLLKPKSAQPRRVVPNSPCSGRLREVL